MKKILLLVLTFLISNGVRGQFIEERAVDISIGMGVSGPYDEYDISGTGFYAQVELVFIHSAWFDLRPYVGMIFTNPSGEDKEKEAMGYKVTANAFLFGGKTRLTAPIPWVAPYVEIGIGGSIGSFETYTYYTGKEDHGLLFHVPFTLGVGLGPNHLVNLEFTYYLHNSVQQYSGAAAVGVIIPLRG